MGNGFATFLEAFEVKFNRLSNESQNFLFRVSDGHTTRKIGYIGSE